MTHRSERAVQRLSLFERVAGPQPRHLLVIERRRPLMDDEIGDLPNQRVLRQGNVDGGFLGTVQGIAEERLDRRIPGCEVANQSRVSIQHGR